MTKKIDEETMLENIENLRSELSETKGFLQTYMLDPDPDSRPAEDERLKTVVRLAGEMEDILAQLTGGVHTEEVKEETPEEKEAAAEEEKDEEVIKEAEESEYTEEAEESEYTEEEPKEEADDEEDEEETEEPEEVSLEGTPEETEEDAEDDSIPVAQDISEPADDINLEYKTHELGTPGEDEDNIEADWNLNEEDMMPAFRAYATSEEFEEKKKEKKAKKDKKKEKKAKKDKKKDKKKAKKDKKKDKKKAKKDKKKDKKKAKKDKKSKKMNKEAGLFADVKTFE